MVRVLLIEQSPLSDGGDGTEVVEATDEECESWIRNMIHNMEMDQPPFMVVSDVWDLERFEKITAEEDC